MMVGETLDFALLAKFAPALGVWLAGCAALFGAIRPVDKFLHPRARHWIAINLSDPRASFIFRRILRGFIKFFDSLFRSRRTKRGIYYVSFLRSAASTLVFLIVIFVLLMKDDSYFYDMGWEFYESLSFEYLMDVLTLTGVEDYFAVFVFAFLFNFIMDYISICETRFILRLMYTKKAYMKLIYLAVDLIATTLIIFACGYLANTLFDFVVHFNDPDEFRETASISTYFLQNIDYSLSSIKYSTCQILGTLECAPVSIVGTDVSPSYSIATMPFVMSTYLTSVWIWIYSVSFLCLKMFYALNPVRKLIDFLVDIRTRPYRAVALLAVFCWTGVYWALLHDYGPAVADVVATQ